jgi:hypothetical protein
MKFLILSSDPTGAILVNRLIQERHEAELFRNIPHAVHFNPDLVVCCTPHSLSIVRQLSKLGLKILGGTQLQADLELDRAIKEKFCKSFGIRFLKETTKKFIPLSVEIWFAQGEPLYKYFSYIKQTRFLAGDLGVETDCQSIVFWAYQNRASEAVERIFGNGLFDFLKQIKYSGPFAVDSFISVDDHYPYCYQIYPRLQSHSLYCLTVLLNQDISYLLLRMSELENEKAEPLSLILENKIIVAVLLSTPPYPYKQHGEFLKYVSALGDTPKEARNNLKDKIIEEHIADIPNIQFRIDAGKQGEYVEELKAIYRFS